MNAGELADRIRARIEELEQRLAELESLPDKDSPATSPGGWQSALDRFEIELHGPDALLGTCARLMIELSAAAPDKFPEFVVEIPSAEDGDLAYRNWKLGHAMFDELYELDRLAAKQAAASVFGKHAKAKWMNGIVTLTPPSHPL